MTYLEKIEAELTKKLTASEETKTIVRWVSERILESYKNGIRAGKKGESVIRPGESRRRPLPPQAQ